jgi:hypothetical protein
MKLFFSLTTRSLMSQLCSLSPRGSCRTAVPFRLATRNEKAACYLLWWFDGTGTGMVLGVLCLLFWISRSCQHFFVVRGTTWQTTFRWWFVLHWGSRGGGCLLKGAFKANWFYFRGSWSLSFSLFSNTYFSPTFNSRNGVGFGSGRRSPKSQNFWLESEPGPK